MTARKGPRKPPVQPGTATPDDNVVHLTGTRKTPKAKTTAAKAKTPRATGPGSRKPYKLDAGKQAQLLDELRAGRRRSIACSNLGIARQTFYDRLKIDPAFAAAVVLAETEANEIIEDALFEAATSGNVTAIQVWLYNRAPDRWADRRGRDDGAAGRGDDRDLAALTDEERVERMKAVNDELARRIKEAKA